MNQHAVGLTLAIGMLCLALSFAIKHRTTSGVMIILSVLAFAAGVGVAVYEIVA